MKTIIEVTVLSNGQTLPAPAVPRPPATPEADLVSFIEQINATISDPANFTWFGLCEIEVPNALRQMTHRVLRHYQACGVRVKQGMAWKDKQLVRMLSFYDS